MAMTIGGLAILAALACLATVGLFVDFTDNITHVVLGVLGALIWGIFGLSAFDVIVGVSDTGVPTTRPLTMVAYLGILIAIAVGGYSLYELVAVLGEEAGATDADGLLP